MERNITKMKGKRVLSMLLALIMTLSVCSPAFSPMMGIIANAAEIAGTKDEESYPVELAFQNLFVFEDWATNALSSTVIPQGYGTLEPDFENGSFRLTKTDMAATEIYTAFSMGTNSFSENEKYYMMPVEPNTTYTFSYNVTGNIWEFTPFVFMYDNQGLFDGLDTMVAYGTPGYGNNSFNFTTPADVTAIQIRFTIGDNSTSRPDMASVYADVKDIAIYKTELKDAYFADRNLFKFEEWKNNPYSNANSTLSPDNGSVVVDGDAIKLTCTSGNFWTGLGIDGEASNKQYYTMAVDPSKSYTLSYDVTNISLPGAVHCQPWIIEMYSDGRCATFYQKDTNLQFGTNKWEFTCQNAETALVQVVFSIAGVTQESSCIVSNIGLYETSVYNSDVDEILGHTHRQAYTYTTLNNGTYGELPVPSNIPEGQVFAGWYTGQNGTGEYISAETPVSYNSYTVYPKYEPKVDSLEIVTPATKLTYTAGEKVDTTGLVLKATRTYTVDVTDENGNTSTEQKTDTFNITSGFRFSPESLTSTGTQNITVNYGGESVEYQVTVNASEEKTITVNGAEHTAYVANNKYTLDYSTTPFNRYEMTYYSDSYVKGVITMDADTEEFFLEPSTNGHFASYIDSFIKSVKHYSVISIEFTCLDKEFGKFELYSVTTIDTPVPSDPTQYYQNSEYKVGISLDYGGVVSEIYDIAAQNADDPVVVRVYNENGKDITRVDHKSILDRDFGTNYKAESADVNLINTNDRGRYLQQSYYGTDQPPYVMGDYNGVPWSYNPVQGGNISYRDSETGELKGGEASKVIDYRITNDQIYIKTRPLDWGKNSEDYPDSYVTDSYTEAWYTFENGMIKTTCRFVDYSGYPSNTTTQEFPALYTIEPLNNFVYNETTAENAWKTGTMKDIEEPDFWGVLPSYNQYNPNGEIDVDVDCYENWAAFTASADDASFGIGVYSAGVTDFHYGVFPAKYEENQYKAAGEQDAKVDGGYVTALKAGTQNSYTHVENYRHAASLDPAVESPTSYISPVGTMTFESYKPSTYSFYVTTGTADQIREDFRKVESIESGEALAKTKVAVPETVYMAPANGASTVGEIYVNNNLDSSDFYNVKTLAEREDNNMYFGVHIADAAYFTVDVSNATTPANDINLCTTGGSAVSTTQQFAFDPNGNFINDGQYELRFSGTGLNPGEKATAKWDITVTMNDGTTQKYAYYTVLYAPERTVGAVAEARKEEISQNEISSWITGANGVDHSQRSPLGSFHGDYSASGYFKEDPLVYDAPLTNITCSGETADDLINVATEYSDDAYVLQTATNGHDHSRAQSYLGLLKVDKSRYTNTNQIPNLEIGYDVLRVSTPSRSLADYYTLYTLGTSESFTSTDVKERPSDWTSFATTTNSDSTIPVRETVIPSYAVSDIDGKYIHALNQARCWYTANMGESTGNAMGLNSYSTAGTSVLCSVTDKSTLRDSVLTGYGVKDTDPTFDEALKNAATVLGDPSATQEAIDNANKELNDAMQEKVDVYYALKYDNLFSAYEYSQYAKSMTVVSDRGTATYSNGTITVVNETITGGEAYTNYGSATDYYHVDLKPNTEYVFEFDVTTTLKAQAFMFFYASDGSGVAPTSMQVKINNGEWKSSGPGSAHWGVYPTEENAHYAIKFTTGANTVKGGFRFGNTSNDPVTSTFSNIKLVDSAHYYEDATYSKTEELFKEYASYGAMTTPVRQGYTFSGWVDANGAAVTGAEIATEHKSIYSTWNENSYTVNYNKNGADVGSADAKIFKYTEEFALPADFSRDYYMFKGWAYSADATAPVFTPGQTISIADIQADKIDSNNQVTLYAVWEKGYSLYYSPNNGTGELSGTFAGYTEPHTVKENTSITRTGYTFLGWSLDQNATTPSYFAGDELTVSAIDSNYIQKDANNELQTYVVLHAVWSEHKYGIAFNANGGSGEMATMPNIGYDDNATLTANTFTKEGYTFSGWNTAANGTGTSYADKESVSKLTADNNANVTLYAQWTGINYTVRFNANTGTGSMSDMTLTYDVAQNLTANAFTKTGYAFMGWSTTPDGPVVYKNGQSVNNLTTVNGEVINLYAVWNQPIVNVTFDNLVDISTWSDTVNNGRTPSNKTDTGFTIISNEGAGEATCESAYFPITAGEKYVIEADIKGSNWDIYVFFCDDAGNWVDFSDGTNRFSSDGKNVAEFNGIHVKSIEFTAPAGATKLQLSVDANNSNNAVRFENIRAYDVTKTTYLETVNKYVKYSDAYGDLPVPVKEGYTFLGWLDENGNKVDADTIMESTSTVYLTSDWTVNANKVNNDTVVIDYGLPVKITVLSNDSTGAVVKAISKEAISDNYLCNTTFTATQFTNGSDTVALNNGIAIINADDTITYTPSNTNASAEDVFYYEAEVDGKLCYAKVTVIPATSVYYEDTFFRFNNATITGGGKEYNYNWEIVGEETPDIFQGVDRPGAFNFTDDLNNAYGFDANYDGDVTYSDGTAHFVEVDSIAGAKGPTAVFTFTGTGFDLFSASDNKSGTVTVTIYEGTEVDSSKRLLAMMSNAYFGYNYDSETGEYTPADNGAIYQIPLISKRDLSYGTYTVVVLPRYNAAFDVAKTHKAGVYVDSVRIYDPMGDENAVANEAYMADGEYAPGYLEIRDTLVTPKGDGTFDVADLGINTSVFLDGGRTSLEDFAKLGPKNEVYLGKDDAIAFHIVTDRPGLPASIQLGMKLTGKGGSSATVNLMNTEYNGWSEDFTLNSATERYYNIESVVEWVEQDDGTYKTAYPVIIENKSDAIISLTSLKWTFSSEDNSETVLDLVTDEQTPALAMAALKRAADPVVTTQQTILNKDNINVKISGEPFTQGDSGVITVITEQGVAGVTVNGADVLDCETDENGKLVWTFDFVADTEGVMSFEIIARDESGVTSEAVYASTDVEGIDDGEEPIEPDDGNTGDGTDDNTGNSGNNSVIGPDSFVENLLNAIFGILNRLFGMILGGVTA